MLHGGSKSCAQGGNLPSVHGHCSHLQLRVDRLEREEDVDGALLVDEELVERVAVVGILRLGGRLHADVEAELAGPVLEARGALKLATWYQCSQ